jgi:Putative DNA-binding domain
MGMTLLQLQRQMAEDVRRPLTSKFAMQTKTEDGSSITNRAQGYIKPNDRLTSFERLEIYNRQYWFRVTASMAEDYPALKVVLGVQRFDRLALAYLRENPSTSYTLRNLGAHLPQWLARHPELIPARRQLVLDVAHLEWAYIEAFDSASAPPLGIPEMRQLGPESTVSLQPHLQLLNLFYPVEELVLAVRKGAPEADVASNAITVHTSDNRRRLAQPLPRMRRANIYLAVHRFENSVYYRRVEREAFLLLSALKQELPLAVALEKAFADSSFAEEMQAIKIQQYFAHASELGWFCRRQN